MKTNKTIRRNDQDIQEDNRCLELAGDMCHLHCVIPVSAHRRAKALAAAAGKPLRMFLAELLMSAEPSGITFHEPAPSEQQSVRVVLGMASIEEKSNDA